jgi:hypothetical protein
MTLGGLEEAHAGWFNENATEDMRWPEGEPENFVIRWENSAVSQERLGFPIGKAHVE